MSHGARSILIGLIGFALVCGSASVASAQPVVTSIQPAAAQPGSDVTINGSGFGTDRDAVRVTVSGRMVPVRVVTPTSIRFTLSPGSVSGEVMVAVGGQGARAPTPLQVIAPLSIISFSPDRGAPGAEVTIRGSGFEVPPDRNRVVLTGIECPVIGGSATELRIRIPDRVRSGVFEVTTSGGARAQSSAAFNIEGAPAPTPTLIGQERPVIDRFEPSTGPVGTLVRIFGRNFDQRVEVWFSGRRLPVIELQPTMMAVEIPTGAATGRFTLRGRFTVESRDLFNVRVDVLPPVVRSFSPTSGPPGTQVEILGERFGAQSYQNRVMLSGRPCIVRSASPGRLVVEVPVGAASGSFSVTVTDAGEAVSSGAFTVFAELSVGDMSPTSGPEGARVTLRGTGFVPNTRDNQVTLNGRAVRVVSATETEIVFEVPTGATSGRVDVTSRGNRRQVRDPFRVTVPPVVERFAPTSGAPGTEVTIYGRNLGGTTMGFHARIGGTECGILSVGPTQARVTIPDNATSGPFEVEVHAQGTVTSSGSFTIYAPVTIRQFEPTRGPTGTTVTITGTGFSPTLRNNTVRIAGRTARVIAAGETELRIEIPPAVSAGRLRVEVRDRGSVESSAEFVVTNAPAISRFTPTGGAPGTEVVLEGDHFGTSMTDVQVTIGGTRCQVVSVGPTRITVRIPDTASTGTFQVAVRDQGSGESASEFSVVAPLTISSFSPSGGPAGTEVTIVGAGFSPRTRDNQVFLGTTEVVVISARAEELRVRIPENATTGRFRILTAGRGEQLSRTSFRVEVALSIEELVPDVGQPGTEVRLVGQGLAHEGLIVLLAGQPVRHTAVSDTEIRVTIPPGARSGPFMVRVPRMGEARSRVEFRVTVPPTIAAFSPNAGPPGTIVTLEGANFSPMLPRNRARIGTVEVRIEAVSPTQMRVRIPPEAVTAPIEVWVEGQGTASTDRPFRVTTPARPTPAPAPAPAPAPVPAPPPPPTVVHPTPGQPTPAPPPPPTPIATMVVQGFSPRAGPPGTMVQLLGDGFGSNPADLQIWIGPLQCRIVSIDGRMLTIQLPPNALTAPIRIMRRGPGGVTSTQTPVPFNVQQ
jgi:hypothetical protein